MKRMLNRRQSETLKPQDPPVPSFFRLAPTWKGNLLVFGLLIAVTLGWFYWQVRSAQQTFTQHVTEQTRLLASVIRLNADSARFSLSVIEDVMETFLGNAARFVDYLDAVEPFSSSELAAFSREIGLSGIRIISAGSQVTEGPAGWLPRNADCARASTLSYDRKANTYFLSMPRAGGGCVVVGFSAEHIRELQEQIRLPNQVRALTGLPEIEYVRMDPRPQAKFSGSEAPVVRFVETQKGKTAEAILPMGAQFLIVGVSAGGFFDRVDQLWRQFFMFAAMIAAVGAFLSWIWYRYQMGYLSQIRDFEKHLAREQEDAALGRASATITHELRNPLNAISMGLQRLNLEAAEISGEHRQLLASLLASVKRTNDIIADLKRYAGPIKPRRQPVRINSLVSELLTLYRSVCREQNIEVSFNSDTSSQVNGDYDLLAVVVENLIKNAIEAQPSGGELSVQIRERHPRIELLIENSGLHISAEPLPMIFEPYFTTKTRGSGLGLATVKRIVDAHGGSISADSPIPGKLRMRVLLPKVKKINIKGLR